MEFGFVMTKRTFLNQMSIGLIAPAMVCLLTVFTPKYCYGEGGWTNICQTWVGDHFEPRPCEEGGSGGSYSPSDTSRRWERIQEENERIDRRNEQILRGKELSRQARDLYNAARYREALELELEALRYLPGDAVIEQNVKNSRAMILVTDGRAAAEAGDYSQAASLLKEAMSINPRYAHLWKEDADANLSASYLVRGQDLLTQRRYSEAEEYIADAIKKFSEISGYSKLKEQAYYSMGRALYGQNREKEAEAFFREAIRINPGNQ